MKKLKKTIRKLFRQPGRGDRPAVVKFAGGMGAQIIQVATYFSAKYAGRTVYADLSYYDPETARFLPEMFDSPPVDFDRRDAEVLSDGRHMMEMGLRALAQPEIRKLFSVPDGLDDILPEALSGDFICVHMRRGDYATVASHHLVPDSDFLELLGKFVGLLDRVVILSDSPIGTDFRNEVSASFEVALFLDDIDVFVAHRVMRGARILIGSNSTFSLTAAALNPDALVIVPRQWFSGRLREIEAPIHSRCTFQIME